MPPSALPSNRARAPVAPTSRGVHQSMPRRAWPAMAVSPLINPGPLTSSPLRMAGAAGAAARSVSAAAPQPSSRLSRTPPATSTGGMAFPTQPVVTLLDAGGNTASSDTSVSLLMTPGTGTLGATLSPNANTTVTTAAGVATFGGLKIDRAAGNYQLRAS